MPDSVEALSIECECAWEPEHGLQLVFASGERLSRVSPYDGHLTWASTVADRSLAGRVYVPERELE